MLDSELFFFEERRMLELANEHRDEYQSAKPFPHAAIDQFLPDGVAESILQDFPTPADIEWQHYAASKESDKLATDGIEQTKPMIRHVMSQLNSAPVIRFLEELTGIEGLIPDPYFLGGGLFQTVRGGYLDIHADFNWHKKLKLHRRVNLIIQLNRDWKEAYGGHLELWDRRMTYCKRVLPIFNRCTIFSPTSTTWHGHPAPLTCPEGNSRKSLAAFYYTSTRPAWERRKPHGTIWRKRPESADTANAANTANA